MAAEAAADAVSATYRSLVLRAGAVCGGVGAALASLVNSLHPRPARSDLGNHQAFAEMASHSGVWVPLHVGLIVAFILIFGGLLAIAYTLADRQTAWLARPALAAACVGTAVSLIQSATDLAMSQTSRDWQFATGADKAAAMRVQAALEDIDFLLFSVELMFFFGVTFILYGLAVVASERYPARLGWAAVVAGVGGIGVGLAQALGGSASVVTLVGTPIVAGTLSAWLIAMATLVWRQAKTTTGGCLSS